MIQLTRPLVVFFACLLAVLAACTDTEKVQREAFITFLQTRLINVTGLRIPKLTEQEKSAFGPYTAQYELIENFHDALNTEVGQRMDGIMRQISFHSVQDILQNRAQIEQARAAMIDLGSAIAEEQTTADMALTRFNQPGDVKAVYDKAYDKAVTQPSNTLKQIIPIVTGTLDTALSIYNYVDQHKDQIVINGSTMEANDVEVVQQLNERLKTLNEQGQALVDAQLKLRKLISGH